MCEHARGTEYSVHVLNITLCFATRGKALALAWPGRLRSDGSGGARYSRGGFRGKGGINIEYRPSGPSQRWFSCLTDDNLGGSVLITAHLPLGQVAPVTELCRQSIGGPGGRGAKYLAHDHSSEFPLMSGTGYICMYVYVHVRVLRTDCQNVILLRITCTEEIIKVCCSALLKDYVFMFNLAAGTRR